MLNKLKSVPKQVLTFCLLAVLGTAQAQTVNKDVAIIPAPNNLVYKGGEFIFNRNTPIYAPNKQDKAVLFLQMYLRNLYSYSNVVSTSPAATKAKKGIIIQYSAKGELPDEGYSINVSKTNVIIRGRGAGLLYGVNTFLQLLSAQNSSAHVIPCLTITDKPRFAYRGLMLDVSRHFFSVKDVKKVIDLMAFYKLNTFHWHLVDDHGWRIEIKKYPKLTAIGGYRTDTFISFNRDLLDGSTYGGFYTQDDIRDVVKYAADRFITIVPEIEMPAHSVAALRAYPELRVPMPEKSADIGSYYYIYNPTEETFKFLEGVIDEVVTLFPGKYIHVGGDEANKTPWKESEFTQKLISDKNLKDVHGLQSYFIQRMEKYINSKGKSIIGWDEILEGGLAPNATVMSWRGEEGGIASAQQKHNVVMSPATNGLYFDHRQSESPDEPVNIGGLAPLSKTYAYNPVPAILKDDEKKYIMGVQANVWTEFIATPAKLEYILFPRMFALAEIAWTNTDVKDARRFEDKAVPTHLALLEKKGVNFRVPEVVTGVDTLLTGSKFTINLAAPIPGSKIYYTFNGRVPGDTDNVYTGPLEFIVPPNETRELRAIVVTATGRRSLVSKVTMQNK